MLTPDQLFSLANAAALLAWLALGAATLLPALRRWVWTVTGLALPAFFAVAYVGALIAGIAGGAQGGFGSIAEVRQLFANDHALTAGWIHYLAFDLIVGTLIVRDAAQRNPGAVRPARPRADLPVRAGGIARPPRRPHRQGRAAQGDPVMTDMAHTLPIVPASPVAELRRRQPALAAVGFAFLILAGVSAALSTIDGRTLYADVSVWAKPAKFFLSGGLLMLTSAWFFGYVRPERRDARALTWSVRVLIATAVFELAYITFQAAQGEASHYNRSDALHQAMFGLMGVAAVAMLATKIPLALEIARRPVAGLDPQFRSAVVLGLWMTVALGTLTGMYLGAQAGHSVGAEGGAAPIFGWNRLGGDFRVAHFFGMHAEQVLPVTAALAGASLGRRWTRPVMLAVAAAIFATTAFVFVQATMGRPFPLG